MQIRTILILAFLLFPSTTFSQKGDLKVFIQDSSRIKHPMLISDLSGATIQIISKADTTKIIRIAYNVKGYFLCKNLPMGKYKVVLKNLRWQGKPSDVEIVKNDTKEIKLTVFNNTTMHGCYKCKSHDLIPITYGMGISDEEKELCKQGKLMWGGCIVMEYWYCKGCKKKIY